MVAKRRIAAYEIANVCFAITIVPVNLFFITRFVLINNSKLIDISYVHDIKRNIGCGSDAKECG